MTTHIVLRYLPQMLSMVTCCLSSECMNADYTPAYFVRIRPRLPHHGRCPVRMPLSYAICLACTWDKGLQDIYMGVGQATE